jgi:hypothetical protein
MTTTLILLAVVALLAGGALAFLRIQGKAQEAAAREEHRRIGLANLRQHLDAIGDRMSFDRLAVGADGRAAVGYLPEQRRLVFVGTAWVDGPAAQRGEVRTFDVGAEDLVGAEVAQSWWARPSGKSDAEPFVRSVLLKVFTSDLDAPTHLVELLEDDARLGSQAHLDALHAAARWEGLVRALVAGSSRDVSSVGALAGLSEEEARRERARQLASKVLAARGASVLEPSGRQVR